VSRTSDQLDETDFRIVGPDYISLIGGEVKNPRRILPKAFKATIWRLVFFYVIGAFCVGIVAGANDPSLLGAIAAGAPGAAKSPYVICESLRMPSRLELMSAMNRLGIPVLPSIVNALILVSIFSTTNSFVFAASRSLLGLAQQGRAPRVFTRLNRQGVPYLCVLLTLLMACLSYLALSQGTVKVLNWWINLVTCAQLVSWSCIAITFLRFYYATKRQNLRSSLPQLGWWQPFSGYNLMVVSPIVLFFSGYYVFLPGAFTAPDFIFAYGSVFIFLAILLVSKAYQIRVKKAPARVWIPLEEIDLVTGVDKIELMTEAAEEKRASKPRTKGQKVSEFFF
jgi:amino acid transporter